jgi:histidyl-tRNA synthetase
VYAIVPDAAALPIVFKTIQILRAQGVSVQMHAGSGEGMGSMKSQFKKADGSGAQLALIFGSDELARGEVTLKALRDGAGAQEAVALTHLPESVAVKLAQASAQSQSLA